MKNTPMRTIAPMTGSLDPKMNPNLMTISHSTSDNSVGRRRVQTLILFYIQSVEKRTAVSRDKVQSVSIDHLDNNKNAWAVHNIINMIP